MGAISRFLGLDRDPMALPLTQALGDGRPAGPINASWDYQPNPLTDKLTFEDLRDPRLATFLTTGRTVDGVRVSEALALTNSTFFRAITLISGAVGMLPIHLMRNLTAGDTEEAADHPFFNVLKRRPNEYQTPLEFKTDMQTRALLDGNAYAMVVRGVRGKILALIPLKRGAVTPILSDGFELSFRYDRPSGGPITLRADQVFHFRGMVTRDGVVGLSLLDIAAPAIGVGFQASSAVGRLFRNGSMVGGALTTDKKLGDVTIDRLRQSLEERFSGPENAGKWLVLEEGMKAAVMATTSKDAQLVELTKHFAEEVSRYTGVPRPLLMFDETSWGSGIEQLGQFFVTYCLAPWFVAWEQAIERCLAPAEVGVYFAKFNEGALLRGSLKDQAEFFAKALGSGGSQAWMTPDEVRANFDQNKIDGGEQLPARMAGKAGDTTPAPKDPTDA